VEGWQFEEDEAEALHLVDEEIVAAEDRELNGKGGLKGTEVDAAENRRWVGEMGSGYPSGMSYYFPAFISVTQMRIKTRRHKRGSSLHSNQHSGFQAWFASAGRL
jgi:hypothetical protein